MPSSSGQTNLRGSFTLIKILGKVGNYQSIRRNVSQHLNLQHRRCGYFFFCLFVGKRVLGKMPGTRIGEVIAQRWPDSRSRPLFGLCPNLFATSLRSTAVRLTELFGSTYFCQESLSRMKIIRSRRSCLIDKYVKYCLHFCLSNY